MIDNSKKNKFVVFENEGILDERLIKTFGVSSKDTDSPIGYFGTGLKYAIAVLLREGLEINIVTGGNTLTFSKVKEKYRNTVYETITMNGEPLAFTTELGKNWVLWQAFRELYANMLDEGGHSYVSKNMKDFLCVIDDLDYISIKPNTYIIVQGEEFEKIHKEKDKIILATKPLESCGVVERHEGPSNWLYYKGIRIHQSKREWKYTYNITDDLKLTEDRLLLNKSNAEDKIETYIISSKDSKYIEECATKGPKFIENSLYIPRYVNISDVFMETIRYMLKEQIPVEYNYKVAYLENKIEEDLIKEVKLSPEQEECLEEAKKLCRSIGCDIDKYSIAVAENVYNSIEGSLGLSEGSVIRLNIRHFEPLDYIEPFISLIKEFNMLEYKVRIAYSWEIERFLVDKIKELTER